MRNNSKASPCHKQMRNVTPLFWVDLAFVLNSMKMPWYSACSLLLFLFRTNGKKGRLGENDFCHCHCIFFESDILKVTWSQLCSKFLPNNYEAHWKQHFERYPTIEYFPNMNELTRNIFHQDFGKHETKIDDSASKKISCAKIQACTSKNTEP